MPPSRKFQVESLKTLCEDTSVNIIIKYKSYIINNIHNLKDKQNNDTLSDTEKVILSWNLPNDIYTDLAMKLFERIHKLINDRVDGIEDIIKLIQFFLNKKLKRLECIFIPREMAVEIEDRFGFIPQITHLKIDVPPTSEYSFNISASSFSYMNHLISLTLRSYCTAEIIESISCNCPNLQELDVSFSETVTDTSLLYLEKLKNLKKLDLYVTNVTAHCLGDFLSKNQTLAELRTDNSAETLNYLMNKQSEFAKVSPLKIFNNLHITTSGQLKFASQFFPKLEQMWCTFDNNIGVDYLVSFKNLKHLQLSENLYYNESFRKFLESCCSNLKSLHIMNVSLESDDLIYDLMKYCINLEYLVLFGIDCSIHSGRNITEKYFQKLETLHFTMFNENNNLLELVLKNCKNIKLFHLNYSGLNHSAISNILSENPMTNLEKFMLYESHNLEINSVRMLLDSLPKLKQIGPLKCWKKISEEDINELKRDILLSNWDLDIDPKLQLLFYLHKMYK